MNINEAEKIVYINLPERVKRNENMKEMLSNSPVSFLRIDGIRYSGNKSELDYKILPRLKDKTGYIGIYFAHLNALEWASENLESGPLILLEDDLTIDDNFWKMVVDDESLDEDWQVILVSPRYRARKEEDKAMLKKDKKRYTNGRPVLLKDVRKKYICTGAHCVIFKNLSVVQQVFASMKNSEYIYDVDLFYVDKLKSYAVHSDYISAGGFVSDHN